MLDYKKSARTSVMALALAAGLASLPAVAQEGELRPMTYGAVSMTAGDWPIMVMLENDLDGAHGLDMDVILTGSISSSVQVLLTGDVQVIGPTIEQIILAIDQGAEIRLIGGGQYPYLFWIAAKPEITSPEQLRGKTIALPGANTTGRHALVDYLDGLGIPEGEWDAIYAGSSTDRFAALRAGGVDAAQLNAPAIFAAQRAGYVPVISYYSDIIPDFGLQGLASSVRLIEEDPELILAFKAAYADALDWLYDPANRDAAIQVLMGQSGLSEEDAIDTYDVYVAEQVWSTTLSDQVLESTMDVLIQNEATDAEYTRSDYVYDFPN